MTNKVPQTPFATRLSGSAKETQLRIRSMFQWKKKRPPVWLFAFIAVVISGCIGLVSCREKEDVLCLGLNARVVEIDREQMILYVQDIDESAGVFGQRCALDCKQAAEEKKLIFVDYETSDLTDISFYEFQVGDELVISMLTSQKEEAKDTSALAEQVQLGTQRPVYEKLSAAANWYNNFLANYHPDFETEAYTGIRNFQNEDRTLVYEDGPENVVESLVSFQYYCQTMFYFDDLAKHMGCDALKLNVENEKKNAQEGMYFKKIILHDLATLSVEDFAPGGKYVSDSKRSFELVDRVNYFKDIHGLTEYAVVYVDLSWQWSEKALSMGPQLGNGRYERLYLVGKTSEDDNWRIYECFWGEYDLGRIYSEQDAMNALAMSELFTASNVSDIALTPTGQLLVAPAAEGQSFAAAYFTERNNYELVVAIWDAESSTIAGTPFRAANSGGMPQVISYEKEGMQRLTYTANGMSQGYTYGQAGDIVLHDGEMVWEWPVQGDIRNITRDPSGKAYQDYLDYWDNHLALISDGGLEIYIENEAFGLYEGSPEQWEFDEKETKRYVGMPQTANTAIEITPEGKPLIVDYFRQWYDRVYFLGEEPGEPQEGDMRIDSVRFLGSEVTFETTGEAYLVRTSFYSNQIEDWDSPPVTKWRPVEQDSYLVLGRGMDGELYEVRGDSPDAHEGVKRLILEVSYGVSDWEVTLRHDANPYPQPLALGWWNDMALSLVREEPTIERLEGWEPIYWEGDYWERYTLEGLSILRYYSTMAEKNNYGINNIELTRDDFSTPRGIKLGSTRDEVTTAYPELKSGDYWSLYPGEDYLWYCEGVDDFGPALIFFFENGKVSKIILNNMFN